jgi:hypothetical protein
MMNFRDMTFCAADCLTLDCPRQFDERQKAAAQRWWGGPGAPVAFANMSNGCDDYLPTSGVIPTPAETGGDE